MKVCVYLESPEQKSSISHSLLFSLSAPPSSMSWHANFGCGGFVALIVLSLCNKNLFFFHHLADAATMDKANDLIRGKERSISELRKQLIRQSTAKPPSPPRRSRDFDAESYLERISVNKTSKTSTWSWWWRWRVGDGVHALHVTHFHISVLLKSLSCQM